MIGFIKGTVESVEEGRLLLENQGIGYLIFMSARDLEQISTEHRTLKVYTYLHVKEDLLQLYGFLDREDLDFFKLLINVNGIGPKGALGILSGMDTDALRFAILAGDAKAVSKAPGIGIKTAQKLILELKDKVSFEDAFEHQSGKQQDTGKGSESAEAKNEAVQALTALGYSGADALKAVNAVTVSGETDTEQILKLALKLM